MSAIEWPKRCRTDVTAFGKRKIYQSRNGLYRVIGSATGVWYGLTLIGEAWLPVDPARASYRTRKAAERACVAHHKKANQ